MKTTAAGGKGSGKRPAQVSLETFDKNFEAIFGKPKSTKNTSVKQVVKKQKRIPNGDG